MHEPARILLVEDDVRLASLVAEYFEQNDFVISIESDGAKAVERVLSEDPDLVILDLMLPGEDGLSACRRLRKEGHIPILMLTALGDDEDRIAGLDGGADDYLAKPFNPKELVARINAILRRTQLIPKPNGFAGKTLKFAHLKLDFDGRTLIDQGGSRTQLTSGELKLLTLFLQRPRTVIGRDELLKLSTGRVAGPLDRTIDNQVSRLRRKMEEDVLRPKIIATVRHGGYSLSCDVEICE